MSEATPAAGGQGAPASASAMLSATPAAPAAPASTQLSQPTPAPAAPAPSWLGEGVDELTTGYVQNKGWDSPTKVVQSYQNLEKLLGADKAGNAIVVPKEGADPKEWAAVYDRLGRPSGPDGYKVDVPEGGNAEFQNKMLARAHELGLTKAQAEGLFGDFNKATVEAMQAQEAAKAQRFQTEAAELKTEWGSAYQQELVKAQQAARGLGLDTATIDNLESAMGHKGLMKFLNQIGNRMGESPMVTGENTGFGNAMTPAQAKAEIKALSADRTFGQKLLSKDADAMAKWNRLHDFAYPEEKK